MRAQKSLIRIYFTGLVAALLISRTLADSITIQNPSFEALTGSNPAYFDSSGALLPGHSSINPSQGHLATQYPTTDPTPGWQVIGTGGTVNENGTANVTPAATDGQNVAWANGYQNQHGYLSQTLGATYQVGVTYELKVDVSSIIGLPVSGFTVSLNAGNTVVASAVNSMSIVPGSFSTVTLDASVNSGSLAAGQPISIVLASSGFSSTGTEVIFDNVRLTSAVPEPSTWLLATLGLLGLAAAGRHGQRR